ncbi:MAG: transcription antitermination factor NusB [bacterium]|nr:transcription antitermination factor NusB [bacterium]
MDISRHQRRIYLVQAIFLWESMKDRNVELDGEKVLKYIWESVGDASYEVNITDFDRERFLGMIDMLDEIREMIIRCAPGWPLEKIASHDRAVLYLGIYELNFTDVPTAVVINESVELAKEFGGDRSSQFINGVLSTITKEKQLRVAIGSEVALARGES